MQNLLKFKFDFGVASTIIWSVSLTNVCVMGCRARKCLTREAVDRNTAVFAVSRIAVLQNDRSCSIELRSLARGSSEPPPPFPPPPPRHSPRQFKQTSVVIKRAFNSFHIIYLNLIKRLKSILRSVIRAGPTCKKKQCCMYSSKRRARNGVRRSRAIAPLCRIHQPQYQRSVLATSKQRWPGAFLTALLLCDLCSSRTLFLAQFLRSDLEWKLHYKTVTFCPSCGVDMPQLVLSGIIK
jgi:hypothetical protein